MLQLMIRHTKADLRTIPPPVRESALLNMSQQETLAYDTIVSFVRYGTGGSYAHGWSLVLHVFRLGLHVFPSAGNVFERDSFFPFVIGARNRLFMAWGPSLTAHSSSPYSMIPHRQTHRSYVLIPTLMVSSHAVRISFRPTFFLSVDYVWHSEGLTCC